MAKQRYINTKFWNDGWIRAKCNPLDRYLFLYILTNEHTNICGIYELPLEVMAFETGIDKDDLSKTMLLRLKPKVFYFNGWVIISNFTKHQNIKNPKIIAGIKAELENIPEEIKEKAIGYGYPIYSLSHSNSNSNSNSNTNTEAGTENGAEVKKKKAKYSVQGAEILKAFELIDVKNKTYYANKTQREACDFLIEEYGFEQVMKLIPKLKGSNMKSFYQITTPWEMKEKITKVFNDVKRKTSETQNKGRGFV